MLERVKNENKRRAERLLSEDQMDTEIITEPKNEEIIDQVAEPKCEIVEDKCDEMTCCCNCKFCNYLLVEHELVKKHEEKKRELELLILAQSLRGAEITDIEAVPCCSKDV